MHLSLVAQTPGFYSGLETVFTRMGTWVAPSAHEHADRSRFEDLVATWHEETRFSSVEAMVAHPAYQEIIAMGDAAVPLIMERQAESPDHWHIALVEITEHDPVPEEAYGDLDLMAQAWLDWWNGRTG